MKLKNKKLIAVGIVAFVLVVAIILVQCLTPGLVWAFTPGAKAENGVLDTGEHIEIVPEGEIRFLLNDNVVFESDSKKGSFMFENPESCNYTLQFLVYEIIGDGKTENLIYTSPMIAPGQFVSGDKLPKKLEKGKYDCVYYARAYLGDELQGEQHGKMTVSVLD